MTQRNNVSNITRFYSLSRVLFWNIILILLAVLVVELVFGSWFSSNQVQGMNILRNQIWHYEVDYPGIPADERSIVYSRDKWGLRGDYGHPKEIDLLTVGGSTTDQRFITEGFTWQDKLRDNFHKQGIDFRVANAGVDGRTTFGHLHDFRLWFTKIEGLKPSYVLLYVGLNDMFHSRPHDRADLPYGRSNSLVQQAKGNSAVYSLLQSIFNTYLVEKRNIGHGYVDYANVEWVDQGLQRDIEIKLQNRLTEYGRRFALLLSEIDKMGARPIVVTQTRGDSRTIDGVRYGIRNALPLGNQRFEDDVLGTFHNETANGVDYFKILQLFNDVSLRLCRQQKGICLDLASELAFEDADFYDYAHTTRSGALKIADYLYSKLSKLP